MNSTRRPISHQHSRTKWWLHDVEWKKGMEEGEGQRPSELGIREQEAWRTSRGEHGGEATVIWLRKPRWAEEHHHSRGYVHENVKAHEQIVRRQAREMGPGVAWIREELHNNNNTATSQCIWKRDHRSKEETVVRAPVSISVYLGKDPSRIHWHGRLNCVEELGRRNRPTGIPLRIEHAWNTPQELWRQGAAPRVGIREPVFQAGVVYREDYVPELLEGTPLAPALRSFSTPVVPHEEHVPKSWKRDGKRRRR